MVAKKKEEVPKITHVESEFIIPAHWATFIAGGVGGSVSSIVTCPLEVIKTRLQAAGAKPLTSAAFGTRIASIFLEIWKTEGIRGLWKGVGPNLAGVAPSRAIHFSTYSSVKRFLTKKLEMEEGSAIHLASAVAAGITVHTVTSPIWLVKTRLQLQVTGKSTDNYKNSFDCVRRVYAEEGVRGFYKGLSASYVGISESALQFVLYERFKQALQLQKYKHKYGNQHPTLMEEVRDTRLSTPEYLSVASAAKLIAAVATYPHEVVRTRLREQRVATINNPHKYTGFFQALKLIAVEEGMRGLYGGMGAHLLRVVPNAAIMFWTYETIISLLSR